jgi:hypothetical protein
MKKVIILLSALLVAATLAGCNSIPKMAARHQGQAPVMLTHSGAAAGIRTLPDWVSSYVLAGNNDLAVEKLPDYKSRYCFVGTFQGPNRNFATSWANSVAGPQAVGATMSTRIESVLDATRKGSSMDDDIPQAFKQDLINNISATFSGVRPVANYWVQWRTYDPDEENLVINEDYVAYSLYVVDRALFDKQITNVVNQAVLDRKNISAKERQLYDDFVARIMARGLDLD